MWTTRCRNHDEFLPLTNCVANGLFVRYSTDGNPPTGASPQYTGPIAISESTRIAAAIEMNGTMHQLVHNAVFTKILDAS
jgi:hypothetical protein